MDINNELQTIIISGILSILSAVVGYALIKIEGYIRKKTGVEIEAYHREALHSALDTAARIAVSRVMKGDTPKNSSVAMEEMRDIVKEYIEKSVPDAIKKLNPPENVKDVLVASAIEKLIQKPQFPR